MVDFALMLRRASALLFLVPLLATLSCADDEPSRTQKHSISTGNNGNNGNDSNSSNNGALSSANPAAAGPGGDVADSKPTTADATKPVTDDGAWLDPTPRDTPWKTRRSNKSAPARVVRLTLRSTPPGAVAMVDGRRIGTTPTFWEGRVADEPHDFVFMLAGHAVARYRFVPVTDGHLHPRLDVIVADEVDAGPPPQK